MEINFKPIWNVQWKQAFEEWGIFNKKFLILT